MTMDCTRASDAFLVRMVASGQNRALGVLWERHRPRVAAIVRSFTSRTEDREDLVQEIMLKAFESLDRLRNPSQFRPWLDTVARRRCVDYLRRGAKVHFQSMDAPADGDEESGSREYASTECAVEDVVVSRAMESATESALGDLTEASRKAFVMRTARNATLKEISEEVGVTEGAAKSLVYRARRTLERRLDPFLAA